MKRFENIEKTLKSYGIKAYLRSQDILNIGGVETAQLFFSKYTHADKALPILKKLGFTLKTGREYNPFNAYFKYYIAIQ